MNDTDLTTKKLQDFLNLYMYKNDIGSEKSSQSFRTLENQPIFLTIIELTILVRIRTYIHLLSDKTNNQYGQILISLEIHIEKRNSFLLSQFGKNCTLNYYPKSFGQSSIYPNDVDDTGSALFAIFYANNTLITPFHISNLLLSLEEIRIPEFPHLFNTWYLSKTQVLSDKRWRSLDAIALSGLSAFFQAMHSPSEYLEQFVFESLFDFKELGDQSVTSEFYHSFPLAFYLGCRIGFDKNKSLSLIEIAEHYLEIHLISLSSTDIALIISTILHVHKSHSYKLTEKEFEIPFIKIPRAEDFTYDISSKNHLYIESMQGENISFASSKYIDSLILFEAYFAKEAEKIHRIKKYYLTQEISEGLDLENRNNIDIPIDDTIDEQIVVYLKEFTDIDIAQALIKSTDFQICKEIVFSGQLEHLIHNRSHRALLEIHALGLYVYHLYDKIMDKELPISSLAQLMRLKRILIRRFEDFSNTSMIQRILDLTDDFYSSIFSLESLSQTKNYTDHYKKSIGVCIIPIIVLSQYEAEITRFFKHYQLARQLADDAKDQSIDKQLGKKTTMDFFKENPDTIFKVIEEELTEAEISIEQIPSPTKAILKSYVQDLSKKIKSYRFESAVIRELKLLSLSSTTSS